MLLDSIEIVFLFVTLLLGFLDMPEEIHNHPGAPFLSGHSREREAYANARRADHLDRLFPLPTVEPSTALLLGTSAFRDNAGSVRPSDSPSGATQGVAFAGHRGGM